MIKLKSIKETLDVFFEASAKMFDDKNYKDFTGVFQFELNDNKIKYSYYIAVNSKKATFKEGEHESPNVTIIASVKNWLDIASGRLSGFLAMITGRLKVKGDIKYLQIFSKVFGKKPDLSGIPELKQDGLQPHEIPSKRVWKKPTSVVVLNGSPRTTEGYTYFFLKPFIDGMKKAGTKVELINVYDKKLKIEGCRGCFFCWQTGKCVIKDDAKKIIDKVSNSYLTIFAMPIYSTSIPGKLKDLQERFFINASPYFISDGKITRHPRHKPVERYLTLFFTAGLPEKDHFRGLIESYKIYNKYTFSPIIATILRPGAQFMVENPFYKFKIDKVINYLEEAGTELVKKGKISNKYLKIIQSNFGISGNEWREEANNHMNLMYGKV